MPFPVCECPAEPSRRGGRRRSIIGERSFPMAMTGTVKFFNGERGYGFIKPEDGTALFDSRVILEYLDHRAGGGRIIPAQAPARFLALRQQALADGLMDA